MPFISILLLLYKLSVWRILYKYHKVFNILLIIFLYQYLRWSQLFYQTIFQSWGKCYPSTRYKNPGPTHNFFEYEFLICSTKSSNQIILCIEYSVLIGCFMYKFLICSTKSSNQIILCIEYSVLIDCFEYEFLICTTKSSNQIILCIEYSVLIDCFMYKFLICTTKSSNQIILYIG
jgi:hypothetical protein